MLRVLTREGSNAMREHPTQLINCFLKYRNRKTMLQRVKNVIETDDI